MTLNLYDTPISCMGCSPVEDIMLSHVFYQHKNTMF